MPECSRITLPETHLVYAVLVLHEGDGLGPLLEEPGPMRSHPRLGIGLRVEPLGIAQVGTLQIVQDPAETHCLTLLSLDRSARISPHRPIVAARATHPHGRATSMVAQAGP